MKKEKILSITVTTATILLSGAMLSIAYAQDVPPSTTSTNNPPPPERQDTLPPPKTDAVMGGTRPMLRLPIRKNIDGKDFRIASTTGAIRVKIEGDKKNSDKKGNINDRENIASSTERKLGDTIENQRNRGQAQKIFESTRTAFVRIGATIVRIEKLVTKLDSRILKIKSAGNDTSTAESASADAKSNVESAKTQLKNIQSLLSSFSSTTPLTSSATSTIKTTVDAVQSNLKTAQDDIQKALKSLEGLHANENATSTEVKQ